MKVSQSMKLLVDILGDITVMGMPVVVLTKYSPEAHLPAITMNSNGGKGHVETCVYKNMSPLPLDHPYFNPQAPETLYNTAERNEDLFHEKILLHIWSESHEERDILMEKVEKKLLKGKNIHYKENPNVQLRDIGARTDIDQYDSYPPLLHSTIDLDFNYKRISTIEVHPLCRIEKTE